MQHCGQATGRQLNASKTVAMPVGPLDRNAAQPVNAAQPAAVAPAVTAVHTHAAGQIRVVQQATSLGVPLVNDWGGVIDLAARHDWPSRRQLVEDRYSRLSRLPLSASGRGFAASAYGLSRLLYHAEFVVAAVGLPPPPR